MDQYIEIQWGDTSVSAVKLMMEDMLIVSDETHKHS